MLTPGCVLRFNNCVSVDGHCYFPPKAFVTPYKLQRVQFVHRDCSSLDHLSLVGRTDSNELRNSGKEEENGCDSPEADQAQQEWASLGLDFLTLQREVEDCAANMLLNFRVRISVGEQGSCGRPHEHGLGAGVESWRHHFSLAGRSQHFW